MKFLLFIFLGFFNFLTTRGQNSSTNRILSTITHSTEPVYIFGKYKHSQFFSLEKPFSKHTQTPIKSDTGLYIFIDGTGLLYHFQKSDSQQQFVRIDSTQIWGYNLGSFSFAYHDKIYNLGGSGIWRSNGHLRVFNEKAHEWDIVPLNIEIPLISGYMEGIISYDRKNGKIYTAYYHKINDGLIEKNDEIVYQVMALDLNKKEWTTLGDFNSELIANTPNIINLTITPMGLLTNDNSNIKLWDFPNNKLYELKDHKDFFQTIIRGFDSTTVFYKNEYLFISRGDYLDSQKITIQDFIQVANIYTKTVHSSIERYTRIIYSLLLITLIVFALFFLKWYKRNIIKKHAVQLLKSSVFDNNHKLVFTDQELLLLSLFVANSKLENKTSIEEINKVLGLESRPIETQKSQRHKLISSINSKYLTITDRKLIQSEKLEFDRRSNVYFINNEDVVFISEFVS